MNARTQDARALRIEQIRNDIDRCQEILERQPSHIARMRTLQRRLDRAQAELDALSAHASDETEGDIVLHLADWVGAHDVLPLPRRPSEPFSRSS